MENIQTDSEGQPDFLKAEYWFREPTKRFKPHAYYIPSLSLVIVSMEDCSYAADRINGWADVHWKNYQSRFMRFIGWRKAVGFSVYYPLVLGLREIPGLITEVVPVREILNRVLKEDPKAFGKKRRQFYRLARDLYIKINYKEE